MMDCKAIQDRVTAKSASVLGELADASNALGLEIESRARALDPDLDTSGPDAWIGIDFDISWDRVEFSLDLPEVTIVQQTWVLNLPQMTMRDKTIIFHTPSVRMKTVKTGEYPETTCRMVTKDIGLGIKTDLPECTVTWSPIYMDVPEPFMQEQRIVMGVPEFEMGQVEVILGIPEFKMKRQNLAMHLPQIKIKNIQVIARETAEKGRALSDESRVRSATMTSHFKERAKLELGQDVKDLFYCYETQLVERRNEAVKKFEDGINILRSTITAMTANNVPDDNPSLRSTKDTLERVTSARSEFAGGIEEKIKELHSQQQGFFDRLFGNSSKQ